MCFLGLLRAQEAQVPQSPIYGLYSNELGKSRHPGLGVHQETQPAARVICREG